MSPAKGSGTRFVDIGLPLFIHFLEQRFTLHKRNALAIQARNYVVIQLLKERNSQISVSQPQRISSVFGVCFKFSNGCWQAKRVRP
jgi:hypothetical protein